MASQQKRAWLFAGIMAVLNLTLAIYMASPQVSFLAAFNVIVLVALLVALRPRK